VDQDFQTRFAGIARLYGPAALNRIRSAHVAVVGLGGVGSWTVEALARSGVGALTLIDLDEVCLSNVNRQLPALDGAIGQFKAEALAERVRTINPACIIRPIVEFFTESSAERLLEPAYHAVVDAIDRVANKARLIAACRDRKLPLIASGGAGGRTDPTRIHVKDLAEVTHDRLLAEVRSRLRREHGFPPAGQRMGIPCVVSSEPPIPPRIDAGECAVPEEQARSRRLGCDWGYGSAAFVTGAFGLATAAWVIRHIVERPAEQDRAEGTDPLRRP